MSKQVSFYWHAGDERAFLEAAREVSKDLCVLAYTSPTEQFEPLKDLPTANEPAWFQVWLWDRVLCKPPVARWVEQQGYYTIDAHASEVIGMSRSYLRDGRLVRGRIWAELSGWRLDAPSEKLEKSVTFRKWFDAVAGWMKRHYSRNPSGEYLGPEAATFNADGGALLRADFAPVVKIVRH